MMKPNPLTVLTYQDTRLLFWLNQHSRKRLIALLSRNLSRCGDGPLYALIGLALWCWEPVHGTAFLSAGLLAYALELPLYWCLKNSIRRNRPCHGVRDIYALIEPSDQFSFPSGHTAAAFVFAMLMATFYPLFAPLAYLLAVFIGLSRVMLGVHYPSDIAAGALLGTACAQLALFSLA